MTYEEIPIGMYVMKALHERTGKHCLHLMVKVDNRDWFDQPHVPVYSQESSMMDKRNREFWEWAERNLPVWNKSEPIKSAYA